MSDLYGLNGELHVSRRLKGEDVSKLDIYNFVTETFIYLLMWLKLVSGLKLTILSKLKIVPYLTLLVSA